MESDLFADESALSLQQQLANSLHVLEDLITALQANVPELNQAKMMIANEDLVLADEIKWVNDVKEVIAKFDDEFCVYEDFHQIMSDINVSYSFFVS